MYLRNSKDLFALTYKDGTICTYFSLDDADETAEVLENQSYLLDEKIDLSKIIISDEIDARVISLDSVHK